MYTEKSLFKLFSVNLFKNLSKYGKMYTYYKTFFILVTKEKGGITMMKSPVSIETVYIYIYIRRNFIEFTKDTYKKICEFFGGFEYIKDG